MRARNSETIEQRDRVRRHVAQRIGRDDLLAAHLLHDEIGEIDLHRHVDSRRAADVAIVESNHAIAARRKPLAERIVPQNHLGAQAHDQQDRRRAAVAERLVAELLPIAVGEQFRRARHIGHVVMPPSFAGRVPARTDVRKTRRTRRLSQAARAAPWRQADCAP